MEYRVCWALQQAIDDVDIRLVEGRNSSVSGSKVDRDLHKPDLARLIRNNSPRAVGSHVLEEYIAAALPNADTRKSRRPLMDGKSGESNPLRCLDGKHVDWAGWRVGSWLLDGGTCQARDR